MKSRSFESATRNLPSRVDCRLLIVKLSSIGDVVQALPVASALRRHLPTARITWAIEDWTAPLVIGHPAVDRVVVFPRSDTRVLSPHWFNAIGNAVRQLRAEQYDVALDLQALFKSSIIVLLSRASIRIGPRLQREGARFVSRNVSRAREPRHAVEEYLECAAFLGAPVAPVSFDLPVDPRAARSIERRLAAGRSSNQARWIVVNPSASGAYKSWSIDKWARLVGDLADAGTVLLVGSRAQKRRHVEITRRARPTPYDLTGETTLAELVALLARCALHVAPDTGTLHVAAALGKPVVGLYGPTCDVRLSPYGQSHHVVSHRELCGASCPRLCLYRRRCLAAVSVEEIRDQALRALAGASSSSLDSSGSSSITALAARGNTPGGPSSLGRSASRD